MPPAGPPIPDPRDGPERLTGPDDPRAAGYRDLIGGRRPRTVDRQPATFVVEGVRTIRQALAAGWELESLLLSDVRAEACPDVIIAALGAGTAVYTAGQEMLDGLAGFHVHRGALALARRPAERRVADVVVAAAAAGRPVLVVEGVNDHENLGSLFRNAAAFGVGAVVLDPTAADPLYRRSVRVSLGHVLRVPYARARSWPAELESVGRAALRLAALTPAAPLTIGELAAAGGGAWAVMVGAEGDGLSAAALAAADVAVRIPMAAEVDSLNVATAAAVALHRLGEAAPK